MSTQMSIREILGRYDDKAALPDASTIPGPWYVDARIAELEAQTVFSKTWQMVGRVEQVEKAEANGNARESAGTTGWMGH